MGSYKGCLKGPFKGFYRDLGFRVLGFRVVISGVIRPLMRVITWLPYL